MAPQEVGSDSIDPQDWDLAEHHTADYSIVHPETHTDIVSFHHDEVLHHSKSLRVINNFGNQSLPRVNIPVKLTTKYLSFASEADFISYASTVLPGIVGPAIDVMASNNRMDKIRQYDNTSFACEANGSNKELNEHLSKLDSLLVTLSDLDLAPWVISHKALSLCPSNIIHIYMEYSEVRDWIETFATLLTEPKLIPFIQKVGKGPEAEVWMQMFVLAHAVQILLFAPMKWHQDASYKSTDSYPRRFPLGYPKPGPDDIKIFGDYSLDDLYRAILLMFYLFQQQSGKDEEPPTPPHSEVWLGYTTVRSDYPWKQGDQASSVKPFAFQKLPRELQLQIVQLATSPKVTPTIETEEEWIQRFRKIQSTSEDSTLALRLSSRGMYNLVKTVQPVEAVTENTETVPSRVKFRINLEDDTLRLFWSYYGLPKFLNSNDSEAPLPVRKLLVYAIHSQDFDEGLSNPEWNPQAPFPKSLKINGLPKLEEFTFMIPVADLSWMIEGLPRVRPQPDNESTAHIGTKWQFNFYRNYEIEDLYTDTPEGSPIGVPPGFCYNIHLDGNDPSDRLGSIPYIGRYGYERSHGIVGGHWAGFKYFQETQEVFFAPLSWTDIEPLVMGPYGANGAEAVFDNHTPQFVAKIWIIREGTSIPQGWIKLEDAGPHDPKWKHQLRCTWKAVSWALNRFDDEPPSSVYGYYLHQR
ncbi:hypothetical protein IL306_008066 [Fusarium sp. DS 682]|nr:hypothetical protein IL306_008066 [Fusarium sp. DS 682]